MDDAVKPAHFGSGYGRARNLHLALARLGHMVTLWPWFDGERYESTTELVDAGIEVVHHSVPWEDQVGARVMLEMPWEDQVGARVMLEMPWEDQVGARVQLEMPWEDQVGARVMLESRVCQSARACAQRFPAVPESDVLCHLTLLPATLRRAGGRSFSVRGPMTTGQTATTSLSSRGHTRGRRATDSPARCSLPHRSSTTRRQSSQAASWAWRCTARRSQTLCLCSRLTQQREQRWRY
jgi:hypothetical protein